ncbi:MAG TPA: TIM barrel protein [Acidobacteriaceae bacterium]|nr:TIM barrel protein [Acidobacteriaceae bacterium]
MITRRKALFDLAGFLAQAAQQLPANRNIKWALGSNLWNSYPGTRFTDILDVMHDTGFIGLRLTQYPQILTKYDITPDQMEREVSRRGLRVITISFNGAADDASQHSQILANARSAMTFLQRFGADRLVVFSPSRGKSAEAFAIMCRFYNQLGEAAGEMGFKAGLHNHLGQMVQTPEEIDRCMAMTDPKLFYFSPDTAHVYLGGGDPAVIMEKYKNRLMMADYKDAKRAGLTAKYVTNTFDLGDGEIDFPACHRVLRSIRFKGWLCADLDITRNGPRTSYDRCGSYIVHTLEPVYA